MPISHWFCSDLARFCLLHYFAHGWVLVWVQVFPHTVSSVFVVAEGSPFTIPPPSFSIFQRVMKAIRQIKTKLGMKENFHRQTHSNKHQWSKTWSHTETCPYAKLSTEQWYYQPIPRNSMHWDPSWPEDPLSVHIDRVYCHDSVAQSEQNGIVWEGL